MESNISYLDLLKEIRRLISFPYPEVCVHYVAANLLSLMENRGYPATNELARSIVYAEDDQALEILDKEIEKYEAINLR